MRIGTWVAGTAAAMSAAILGVATPGGSQAQGYSGPPSGSYWQSCEKVRVSGTGRLTLWAECRDYSGRYVTTSLDYEDCRGEIVNENGRLSCYKGAPYGGSGYQGGGYGSGGSPYGGGPYGGGGWNPGPPPGGGYNNGGYSGGYNSGGYDRPRPSGGSITLYDGVNYTGVAFGASREITNLPRQNNDRALSLKIGRGSWEVCTDKDFGGRCQIFRESVPDLNRVGMAYAITSMRQVR